MNAIAKLNQIEYKAERAVLLMLLAAVCGLCGLYFYLLSASVVHVVFSQEAEEKMHKLASEIASLEATYMEKQHSISMEVVERHGYVNNGKKIFIEREKASVVTRR